MGFKQLVRSGANRLGFDIIRFHQSPSRTLLGLSHMNIDSVIDIGANQGQFARMISHTLPNVEIHCFEPLADPFGELSAWAETQQGRVHCYQLALGDQEGEMEMHLHENHVASSSLLATTDTCHRLYPQTRAEHLTRIQMSTLDAAMEAKLDSMPRDILLKLDVQGFEDRVLRGGQHVLSQCHVVMLEVSLDTLYEQQADFGDLVALLDHNGFRYAGNVDQIYAEDGHVVFLDAIFLRA